MKSYHLDYCEFYITNVCNLNCDNCNRFNNFAFSGHQDWLQYQPMYEKWAQILDIGRISILGGEPMLNPDFMNWVTGIADLWPGVDIRIITNGTQLHRWPQLYDTMASYRGQIWLEINVHNSDEYDATVSWVRQNFLRDQQRSWHDHVWNRSYQRIRDPSWPDCDTPENFELLPDHIKSECQELGLDRSQANVSQNDTVDSNLVRVSVCRAWTFYPSAVQFNDHRLTLHHSDPARAMSVCMFKPCHHFIRGALYKCGPVGLLPDFIKQFPVYLSDQERVLINSYKPAQSDWSQADMTNFIQNLRDAVPIDQCRFCPENTDECGKISSSTKKIPIKKISITG